MSFYINLLLTYIFIGVVFSSLFYFVIRKNVIKHYGLCLLFGIIGSFFGVFFNAVIPFDPLKYIYFFREVVVTGIFWPSVFSFVVLMLFSNSFRHN